MFVGGSIALAKPTEAPPPISKAPVVIFRTEPASADMVVKERPAIVFRHGDVSWLPALALLAGWPVRTHERLAKIVLRESGGCPARRGGDRVDKNCVVIGVADWSHRSDTGLLQINWQNYDVKRAPNAILCRELAICVQEPLLDPFINLVAGKVLYDAVGWSPWDFCQWGPKFAKQCARTPLP